MKALRLPIAAMFTLLISCGEGGVMVEETPVTPLGALYEKRIFFGHQSVGRNIIEGIGEVLQGAGARGLVFVETRDPGTATGPGSCMPPSAGTMIRWARSVISMPSCGGGWPMRSTWHS